MTKHRLAWVPFVLLGIIFLVSAGCGANRTPAAPVSGVPWPPPPGVTRQTSDDVVNQQGDEAVEMGGGAKISGTGLKLPFTPGQVTYGIWSLGGFSVSLNFTQVKLYFNWLPDPPNALTKLFIGLANYTKGYWEWYEVSAAEAAAGEWLHAISSDTAYVHNGSVSVAAIITGIGSASIANVEFTRVYSDVIPIPQNLHVTDTNIGSISLDWDDVPDITGYNLYRAKYPDFSDQMLVEGSPIAASEFIDLTGLKGAIMYYKVAAVRGTAVSGMSNMVDIFDPQADIILPDNIQFGTITPTSVEITWEWHGGTSPETWVVYWKTYPNFHLYDEGPDYSDWTMGYVHHYTFEGLTPDSVYFFRVAARDADNKIGRMTDDAPLSTEPLWEWGPVEETGFLAVEPICAVVADGDFTVSYYDSNLEKAVKIARRAAGIWTGSDTPLDTTVEAGGFTTNQALAFSGGTYMLAARTKNSDDVWATTGTPGSWAAAQRIHGDGSIAPNHPYSGLGMNAAANDTTFSLVHFFGSEGANQVLLQQLPVSGGSWTTQNILNINNINIILSPAYIGSTLGVLVKSDLGGGGLESTEVYLGTSDDSFTWTPITPEDGSDWGQSCVLSVMSGHWIALVLSLADNDPFFFTHDGTQWTYSPMVVSPGISDGRHLQIAVDGTNAYCLHNAPNKNLWYFAVFEGGVWTGKPFAYGTGIGTDPQLMVLNGSPYIIYVDSVEHTLKAVMGTPPA